MMVQNMCGDSEKGVERARGLRARGARCLEHIGWRAARACVPQERIQYRYRKGGGSVDSTERGMCTPTSQVKT